VAASPKVLHVIAGLGAGGAEGMLAALVTAERADAPEQIVVNLLSGGVHAERIRAAGIALHELGMRRGRLSLKGVGRLAALIAETRPDVIQSWMYHADLIATLALIRSGRRKGTDLYWGVRCSDMDVRRYPATLRLVTAACARLSHLPRAVVANSEAGRRVHAAMGYRPKRFLVIDNGIDTERFRPDPAARAAFRRELGIDPEVPVAILPARLDPMKDHETFLAAIDRLNGVVAMAVGDKTQFLPERRNLVTFGLCQDMPRAYAAADFVISSSAFGEGFSNGIAEGMAAGLPAVATDVGDARRIIADTGVVVPPRDPAALAGAIDCLAQESPEDRERRSRAARARICDHYALERFVAAFDVLHRGEA